MIGHDRRTASRSSRHRRLWAGLSGAGALVALAGGLLLLSAASRYRKVEAQVPSPPPAGGPSDSPGFVSDAQLVELMDRDVRSLPERDRRFARYLTLVHLANAGRPADELRSARAAVARLINGLSWNRQVVTPRPVDAGGTVLRIDLRDYSWTERTWRHLLAAYSHGIVPDSAAARSLFHAAGGDLPYVRGDWFVARAARPPLYHDLLGLPDNEPELRKRLHIDDADDARLAQMALATSGGSERSPGGWRIERHGTPYGGYWRGGDSARGGRAIVFNLPNGLHACMSVNGAGRHPDGAAALESALATDDERHRKAVSRMGGGAEVEPETAAGYETDLDLTAAAAELGLRPAELSARLNGSAVLAPLKVRGGTVRRQAFNDALPDLVRELRLGAYLPPENGRP
jgi:hypothetical protein